MSECAITLSSKQSHAATSANYAIFSPAPRGYQLASIFTYSQKASEIPTASFPTPDHNYFSWYFTRPMCSYYTSTHHQLEVFVLIHSLQFISTHKVPKYPFQGTSPHVWCEQGKRHRGRVAQAPPPISLSGVCVCV